MVSQELSGRYKRLDRLLHRLAFLSGGLQVSLADIEDRLYSTSLVKAPEPRPVFLTELPRSRTTVLLNLRFRTGSFVSHTYRHVPFVLCPMIWNRLSGRLRTSGPLAIDRAHGDGKSRWKARKPSRKCYESLVREPERALARLGDVLGLAEVRELTSQAATLRPPSGYDVSKYNIPPGRVTEARDLYQQLYDISI